MASQIDALCKEISLVSQAAGYTHTAKHIHAEVANVVASTAKNRSSMLADVQAGRRSENEYISGYFLKMATRYEIPTPHTRALFEGIKLLDEQILT